VVLGQQHRFEREHSLEAHPRPLAALLVLVQVGFSVPERNLVRVDG